MWVEADKFDAEDKVENSLSYFRNTPKCKTSLYKRNLNRNIIIREVKFLKDNFPESYILEMDMSDVDLVIEKGV